MPEGTAASRIGRDRPIAEPKRRSARILSLDP
jgi:hypothetical protein